MPPLAAALEAARFLTGDRDGQLSIGPYTSASSSSSATSSGSASADVRLAPIRRATQAARNRLEARVGAYAQAAGTDALTLQLALPPPPPIVSGAGPRTSAQETAEEEDELAFALSLSQLRTGLAALDALARIGQALESDLASRPRPESNLPAPEPRPRNKREEEEQEADPSQAPLLGSADRKTLATLVAITNQWSLDLMASLYDRASAAARAPRGARAAGASVYEIGSAADPFARLNDTTRAAGKVLALFARVVEVDVRAVLAAAQGGKPAPPAPPARDRDGEGEEEERISSLVLRSASAPLFRLAFRVAYDSLPAGHAQPAATTSASDLAPAQVANALLKTALRRLNVLQCYAALSGVTARVHGGQPVRGLGLAGTAAGDTGAGHAASLPPPPGAAAQATRFLSAQLLRPGGVRAMLSIMLLRPVAGARAAGNPPPPPHGQPTELAPTDTLSDAVLEHEVDPAPSPAKVQRVVSLLSTPPPRLPTPHWLAAVVPQLLDIITDAGARLVLASVPRSARGAEQVHAATALTAIQHLASLHPDVYPALANRLVFPFAPLPDPKVTAASLDLLVPPENCTTSLQTLLALISLGPPDPTFLHTVLNMGQHVPPLLLLAGLLRQVRQSGAAGTRGPKVQIHDPHSGSAGNGEKEIDRAALADAIQTALGRWCSTRSADQRDEILAALGPQPGGALSPLTVQLFLPASGRRPASWTWSLEGNRLSVRKVVRDAHGDGDDAAAALASLLRRLSTEEQDKLLIQDQEASSLTRSDPVQTFLPALEVAVDLLDQVEAQDNINERAAGTKSRSTLLDDLVQLLLMELVRVQRSRTAGTSDRLAYSAVLLQGITRVLPRATPALYTHHALPVLLFIDYALGESDSESDRPPAEAQAEAEEQPALRPVEKDSDSDESRAQAQAQAVLAGGMRPAAASLLVELLYNNTTLSVDNTPLLGIVMGKLEALVDHQQTQSQRTNGLLPPLEEEPLLRVLPTLRLILRARSAGEGAPLPTAGEKAKSSTPQDRVKHQFAEAMALIQNPSVPVRGHGLVQLTRLVGLDEVGAPKAKHKPLIVEVTDPDPTSESQPELNHASLSPSQLEQVLAVFLAALDEEDSYVYMNAIKGLAQFALRPDGGQVFRHLVDMYVRGTSAPSPAPATSPAPAGARESTSTGKGKWAKYGTKKVSATATAAAEPSRSPSALSKTATVPITVADVDRRLRVGEAIGQVIQRLGQAMAPKISLLVNPLLAFVRDAKVPTTLCVSTISLLGTLVEAAPKGVALSGVGNELASLAIDLLTLEGAKAAFHQQPAPPAVVTGRTNEELHPEADDDEEGGVRLEDDPLSLDRSLPQLRRAAFLLLDLLLVGTESQRSPQDPQQESLLSPSQGGPVLRLPERTPLALIPHSQSSPREAETHRLLDQALVVRIKQLALFATSSEADPVAQDLAQSCVDQADAILAATL